MGNHASVIHALRDIGFRVRVSADSDVLDQAEVLLLPGVGAFPGAMHSLHERGLAAYLQSEARRQRPIVGICLGMQLLTTASYEHQYTAGLDLIPGEVRSLGQARWHIGWNAIECLKHDAFLSASDGEAFYFNHSFSYRGSDEFQFAVSRHLTPIVAVIRRGSVVGVQFHPEKSQSAGRVLLRNLITGLCYA